MTAINIRETLALAIRNLASPQLKNEAQVKAAVILPVLRALGWDDTNPDTLLPEYPVPRGEGKGWVDYALLDQGEKHVFVEAKKLGGIDVSAETQLFEYAANEGVPILILTDGKRWDFYLSMAGGLPTERRFHRLELESEQDITEYEEFLLRHVERGCVLSGEARRNAESRRESNRKRERARKELLSVWNDLIKERGGLIQEYLQEEVKKSCGIEPEMDDVEQFLQKVNASAINRSKVEPVTERGLARSIPKSEGRASAGRTKIVGFAYRGEPTKTGTAKATLVEIVKRFVARDEEAMERFSHDTQGRNRALVSRVREDLYPNSPHLVEDHSVDLGGGWWLGTNLSAANVREHIRTACKVAGVSGLDLIER
ncbi:MAG: hypothetical protein OXE81_05485 [Gammaproteobacteria bacterium]|nr:hypothetical protein [Gammaproteobacteria bacterium]MCY4322974.1 hypothetical protein [Gammaproteobacteria bacterium]